MGQNAATFEENLAQKGIVLEKNRHEDNALYVIHENLEGIGHVSLMALFNDSDRYVTLICFKYLEFPPEKRPAMLDMINRLNSEYTMVKFVETDNAVSIQIVVPFHDNFSTEVIFSMIALIFQSMKEENPRLLAAMA